jgi:hypothetical protein
MRPGPLTGSPPYQVYDARTGATLYLVQNRLNRVAVIELAPDLGSGSITGYLTNRALDVPMTSGLTAASSP